MTTLQNRMTALENRMTALQNKIMEKRIAKLRSEAEFKRRMAALPGQGWVAEYISEAEAIEARIAELEASK